MERYRNSSGNSEKYGFEIGIDYIKVKFTGTTKTYTYSYGKAGMSHVENMKRLARNGSGLNAYINKKTRDLHDK